MTRAASYEVTEIEDGLVENWAELTTVNLPLVSFRWTFAFPDGDVLTSDSTLRFRDLDQARAALETTASSWTRFAMLRSAGRELVYFARRP